MTARHPAFLHAMISKIMILPGHERYTESLQRAQILRTVILFLIISDLLLLLTLPLINQAEINNVLLLLIGVLPVYAVLLLLTRPPYLHLVSWVTVLLIIGITMSIYLMNLHLSADRVLDFLILSVFIASITLSLREAVLSLLIICMGILLMPLIAPVPFSVLYYSLIFNIMCSALILTIGWLGSVARQMLHDSESRYRALMAANIESIMLADVQGRVMDANPAFTALVGKSLEELRGSYVMRYAPRNEWSRLQSLWEQNVTEPFEMSFIGSQQQVMLLEIVMRPYSYMGEPAIVVTVRDVTQRKHAERQSREMQQRYEALFTQTSDAVFLMDLQGQHIDLNDMALQMFKTEYDDMIRQGIAAYVGQDELKDSFKVMARLLAGERVPIYERKFIRGDGSSFIGEVNVMLVRDTEGEPVYIQSIVRDTSERKRSEGQKFELAIQQERIRVLRRFIDDISHHFRTPITKLKTSAYLLPRFVHLPEKQQMHYKIFETELQRMDTLLEDLLTIVRLEKEETGKYHYKRFEINEMLAQVLDAMRGRRGGIQHQMTYSPCPQMLLVLGDGSRLAQAIIHILNNAMMYTPADGRVALSCFVHEKRIVIQIEDTGIGIASDALPHIFENFYRTDNARSEHPDSVGLGLSIVEKIVQIHRGLIRVSSQQGEGSIFQIILPQAQDWQELLPEHFPTIISAPEDTRRSAQLIQSV